MCAPSPASAQQPLEHWLDDLLPRTPWTSVAATLPTTLHGSPLLDPTPRLGFSTTLQLHRLGLGPWSLRSHKASVELRQPLATRALSLHVRASHRLDSHLELDGGELWSEAPAAVDADITGRIHAWPGRWALRLGGGWEGGRRWIASLAGESRYHRIEATHASRRDPALRLNLPAADVDGATLTTSSVSAVKAELRWPGRRFRGSALGVEWSRETSDPRGSGTGPDLRAVVAGTREEKGIGVRLRPPGPVALSIGYRTAHIGSDGSLTKNDQRAGRLFFGRLHSERWNVSLGDPSTATADPAWRGSLSWGRADGALSARLETWPFREVWDQLGAVAYRVRGDLGTRWTALAFSRRSAATAGWSLGIQRIRLRLDGEDWLVTGLGFGRSDHRSLENLRATVLLVGGELRRPVPGTAGRASLWLKGSLPVRASWNDAVDEALVGGDWVGGAGRWATVTAGLSWF